MEDELSREKTFDATWPHRNTGLTADRLAAAGFYFSPTSKVPDRAVCFVCENALTNWDPTDDPWIEHKTWYPQCPFVQGRATGNIPKSKRSGPSASLAIPPSPRKHENGSAAPALPPNGGVGGGGSTQQSERTSSLGGVPTLGFRQGLNSYIQALQSVTGGKDDTQPGAEGEGGDRLQRLRRLRPLLPRPQGPGPCLSCLPGFGDVGGGRRQSELVHVRWGGRLEGAVPCRGRQCRTRRGVGGAGG